jgi:hypothetical protein
LKIAEIAPPWVRVPPERYGGIEWIVSILADGLVDRRHDVTLYATGDSRTRAHLRAPFEQPVILGGKDFYGAVHPMAVQTLSAYLEADRYDVIHDHTGAIAACLGALSNTYPRKGTHLGVELAVVQPLHIRGRLAQEKDPRYALDAGTDSL